MLEAVGNLDRRLTEEESRVAGKAMSAFMRALGGQPREVATYTLSLLVTAMASSCENPPLAEQAIVNALRDLQGYRV